MKICKTTNGLRLLIVTAVIASLNETASSHSPGFQEDQISVSIKGLWSADFDQRRAAKAKLIESGPAVFPHLAAILNDLFEKRHPRFAIGQEAEGMELLQRCLASKNEGDRMDSFWRVTNLSINERLRDDIVDMVVRMRNEAGVPLLIRLMEVGPTNPASWERMDQTMTVLVELGPVAVPVLIREIQSVNSLTWERASAAAFNRRITVEVPMWADPKVHYPARLSQPAEYTNEEKIDITQAAKRKIEIRSAMILGRIGDKQALSILEDLMRTEPRVVTQYVEDAIRRIKEKNEP